MEYLTIYRPYYLSEFTKNARSDKESGDFNEAEAENLDDALNKYANRGFRVINSGIIVCGEYVTFWAMLEKA
jgi:hypothetical protein